MMLDSNVLTVHFWGVRGSYPTPGPSTLRYGGNTSCISIHFNGNTLIFDSGTGIIRLGRELVGRSRQEGKPPEPVVMFSHYHHDHTQGFPFFAPTRLPDAHIRVFGPRLNGRGPRDVLSDVMSLPLFPLQLDDLDARIDIDEVASGDVLLLGDEVGGVARLDAESTVPRDPNIGRVLVHQSFEHPNGVLHYRFEWRGRSVVYATDREGPIGDDHPLVIFSRHADLLIHDSQYTQDHYEGKAPGLPSTRGFGHSTIAAACEVASRAEVGQLALFHLDPSYSDDQMDAIVIQARGLFPNTISSAEDLELVYEPCEEKA